MKTFSCFLIGEGSLLIQCAELLLERGNEVVGIVSPDQSISNWGKVKGISQILPSDNILEFLQEQPFDYLFSISNTVVLPKEILELPRKDAINFHDAPLPKYAGANATAWALIQQEKIHGVCWHRMTEVINGGHILKQVSLEIARGETSHTLNGKCYEAAIDSFSELIGELVDSKEIAIPQNKNQRTYYPSSKRPSAESFLSFNRCAYELDALVRALSFGPYPNPLGRAKLEIGGNLIVVSRLEVLDRFAEVPPGTIIEIEPDFLKISTSSYEIVLRELQTLEGEALSIPDLVKRFGLQVGYRFQDADLGLAKSIEKTDSLIAKYEAFWVERLANLQPVTIPYADQTASHLKQKRFESVKIPVPDEVISFWRECHPGRSLGDFLLAAFVGYVARIGGTDEFDTGFRDVELARELSGSTGFFAAYVPCRLEIDLEQGFEDFFETVREQVALTKQHKTYAQDTVVRYPELREVQELGGEQIFAVVIERVEKLDDYQGCPGNELTFIISEDEKECGWFYNADALDGDSVARMADQFTIFQQGIVTDSRQQLAYLPLLSEEERHKILVEWNDTKVDYPLNKCIHHLFEEQVERTPDNVAVVFEDQHLTYRELNIKANQLAHYLQKLGVQPEVLVGICVERSLDLGVVILGTLKAGGACVLLDPTEPEETLTFFLEDTQLPVLVTQKRLLEVNQFPKEISRHRLKIICLDTIWESLCQESSQTPFSEVTAENIAYITYTSGSTGKPKGVMTCHRALCSRQLSWQSTFQLTEADRLLLNVYRSLILHYLLIGPLLLGGRAIIARPDGHLDSAYLVQLIAKQKITGICVVPSLLRVLLQQEGLKTCNSLRKVFCGSEALPIELQEQFFSSSSADLYNIYGLTETTFSTIWKCQRRSNKEFVPIGCPTANAKVYILDSSLQPVPVGILGELYIGGDGLARGYLNRLELTAERFIPNPFSEQPSMRLYKTGDLACRLADGSIRYLGRIDRQVKVRGFRIELEEVETVLAQHPSVQQTVVLAREDIPGDKRLVAYIVPKDAQIATFNQLRSFLTEKLPNYMVPSFFILLETLPLMSNGKPDYCALPAPSQARPEIEEAFVAPRNAVEEVLSDIWGKVLNVEQVGLYDNFFVLGGDSLLGTQLISSVHKVFQVKLPLRSLFETPTLIEMSQAIIKHQASPLLTEKIAQTLQRIKNMPVEEIRETLLKKKANVNNQD